MSLHPRNRTDKQPTHHSLLDCDYVISDFGTIVYEAWALGKPVIFPHWLIGDRIKRHLGKSAEAFIFHERLGLHADSPQQMIDFVMDGAGIDAAHRRLHRRLSRACLCRAERGAGRRVVAVAVGTRTQRPTSARVPRSARSYECVRWLATQTSWTPGARGFRIASVPPSAYTTEPTIRLLASESRKPISAAISSGRPGRPIAVG